MIQISIREVMEVWILKGSQSSLFFNNYVFRYFKIFLFYFILLFLYFSTSSCFQLLENDVIIEPKKVMKILNQAKSPSIRDLYANYSVVAIEVIRIIY